MQTLSSVTNAVALQIGLLADTIPHYDVIAELLHFDHVKSSDFKNPISNDVETILNSFATLPDQFKKDVTDVLAAFDTLIGIKKQISGVKDVKSWNSEKTLQSDLEDLGTNGLTLTSYENIEKSVRCISSNVDTLGRFKKSNTEEDSKGTFNVLSQCIGELLSEPAKFVKTINDIVKLKSGTKAAASFSDMLTISKTMKTFKDNEQKLKVKAESKTKLNNNFDLVSKVSVQSVQLTSYLETVLTVLAAPSTTSSYRALTYTAGLPNGFEDLKSVPLLRSDTWLESITDTTSLFKALKLLDVFIDKVKSISQQLMSYRTPNPLPADTIKTFLKNPEWSETPPEDPKSMLTTILDCTSNLPKNPTLVDLEPLSKEIAQIDEAVESIRKSMGESIGLLTNNQFVKMINDIKEISSTAASLTDKAKLKESIDKLLKYPRMAELNSVIKSFNIQFSNVDTAVASLKTSAKSVKVKLADTMTKFQDLWTAFEPSLSCIHGLDPTKIDDVKNLIERTKKLQTPMPNSVMSEISSVVNIVTTFQTMTDLSAVINSMKSQETEETKQFSDLVDSEKLSEAIGTATRGIVNFKDLSERKSQFESIQKLLPSMETDISTRQGLTQPEIEAPIELKKLQKMSVDLEKWRSGVKLPNPDTIPNYADIFAGGLDLTSEDINEPIKLSEILGNLESTTADSNAKKNLLEIKTALDELNSVGVKLSVYKDAVTKTRDTLNSLNTYFANHQKKVVTIPVQKATPLSILTSTGFVEVTTIAGVGESSNIGLIILIVAFVIVLLICSGFSIAYCRGWRPCQKKNGKNDEETPLIKPATPGTKTLVSTVDETKNETAKPEKKDQGKGEKKEEKKEDGHEEKKVKEEEKKDEHPEKKDDNEGKKDEKPVKVDEGFEDTEEREEEVARPKIRTIKPWKVSPDSEEKMLRGLKFILRDLQKKENKHHEDIPLAMLLHYCAYVLRIVRRTENIRTPFDKYLNQTRRGSFTFGIDKAKIRLHLDSQSLVQQKNYFISGVCNLFPNLAKWFLCETPMVPNKEGDIRTDDKFALFVAQVRAGAVVFLCAHSELKSASEPTYGEYFPTSTNKPIEIPLGTNGQNKDENAPRATLQKDLDPKARKEMEKYEHSYEGFNPNDIDYTFNHYHFNQWKAGSAPSANYVDAFKNLLHELEEEANVIVHCSDGIERSGALAFMESMRQSSDANINCRQQYSSIRDVRPGALEVNVQSAFAILVCVEIAHHAYNDTSLDPLGKRIHAKKKTQHKEVPEMYERLREMYDYALAHPEEKDEVKEEKELKEEQKKDGDVPKDTKKPTETVVASKPVEKPADTGNQVDKTQESDPLLEKPSLKEQKTQKIPK
ncbi:hypothetical protein CAEBREN_17611 [Caenorhabditis brenneri]|uniref:Tyrosine-protein phosphatase domain-containing protein n=1 Tax=Caenorhabditis brenneri TaxID=135651 RepID=G0NIW6_CAEBE|nr:hypothetical protein CAEBREN_17611 [Caenorhabditis brenneri]